MGLHVTSFMVAYLEYALIIDFERAFCNLKEPCPLRCDPFGRSWAMRHYPESVVTYYQTFSRHRENIEASRDH